MLLTYPSLELFANAGLTVGTRTKKMNTHISFMKPPQVTAKLKTHLRTTEMRAQHQEYNYLQKRKSSECMNKIKIKTMNTTFSFLYPVIFPKCVPPLTPYTLQVPKK